MDLKEKKILILGANHETIPLIMTALNMNIEVHVTDYNSNAPAKKFANYAHNIDCMDIEGLLHLCYKNNFNGIMVGVADSLINVYSKICSILNLNSYCNEQQSRLLSNKLFFNELCSKHKILSIPNYNKKNLQNFNYCFPLLVKPVDSNSGMGISICKNSEELSAAIKEAILNSKTNKYLVEKYMNCDDMFVYYTFYNGEPILSATADRYTVKQGRNSKVCTLAVYPSKYTTNYIKNVDNKLKILFHNIELLNGVFLVSAFVENDEFYLYDPGLRLQGEAPDIHIQKKNNFNQREFLIKNSLNETFDYDVKKIGNFNFNNTISATLWILLKKGVIKKVEGISLIKKFKSVIKIAQRFSEGEKITENMIGTERQVFCRIYININNNNLNELYDEIKKIKQIIKITNESGDNLIVDDCLSFLK